LVRGIKGNQPKDDWTDALLDFPHDGRPWRRSMDV